MLTIILKDLIKSLGKYNETLNVSFECKQINSECKCVLMTDEELDKYDSSFTIGLYAITDILENLRLQKEDYSEGEAINAINFYLQNDAFIDILN